MELHAATRGFAKMAGQRLARLISRGGKISLAPQRQPNGEFALILPSNLHGDAKDGC